MWTAWNLLERGARVVLLEADVCGHGPSGRNGGFCETLWSNLPSLRERFGDERALAACEASSDSVRAIGAWCEAEGVDAWFRPAGFVETSTSEAQDAVIDGDPRGRRGGRPTRSSRSTPSAVRARCDSPRFRRGLLVPDDATVQPARLALGLRRRLLERGVAVYEHSRVRALRAHAGGVVAETRDARVRAGAAVLAINAATRGVRPLRVAAVGHLVAHRADRAGARRARADRLDRGRVDHRRAHVPALLPHHARRPHRLRLGRRAAGGRRAARRPHRGRPARRSRRSAATSSTTSRRSRAARSRTPGAARSTSRRATCRRSARSTTARSTTRSASPATASARRTSPAACWPGWRSATATAGWRSTSPGRPCRASRWRGWAGWSCAARSCAPSGCQGRAAAGSADARGLRGAASARDPRVALTARLGAVATLRGRRGRSLTAARRSAVRCQRTVDAASSPPSRRRRR